MPTAEGIGHIALTVTDVPRSAAWYAEVFGVSSVLGDSREDDFDVLAGGSLLIGLRRHPTTSAQDRFDEGRVGLDHAAVLCADVGGLERWQEHLDALDVAHSPIEESPFGSHLNFKDPDGIALELHTPPPPA